jgi:hypothetical protein
MQVQAAGVQGSTKDYWFTSELVLWLRSTEDSNDELAVIGNESDVAADSKQR